MPPLAFNNSQQSLCRAALAVGFRPCGASQFFLLRQEKVSKKKATLGRCPLRGFPALLGLSGGCGTRGYAPQTVLALFPLKPALLGTFQGARKSVAAEPTELDIGISLV